MYVVKLYSMAIRLQVRLVTISMAVTGYLGLPAEMTNIFLRPPTNIRSFRPTVQANGMIRVH